MTLQERIQMNIDQNDWREKDRYGIRTKTLDKFNRDYDGEYFYKREGIYLSTVSGCCGFDEIYNFNEGGPSEKAMVDILIQNSEDGILNYIIRRVISLVTNTIEDADNSAGFITLNTKEQYLEYEIMKLLFKTEGFLFEGNGDDTLVAFFWDKDMV